MSLIRETHALRKQIAAWAAEPEWSMLSRYDLLCNRPPCSFTERVYRWWRRLLTRLGLAPPYISQYSWLPTLKHAPVATETITLLIWAPGVGREELRLACEGFLQLLKKSPPLVPVLVTDVADFAYFSRLKWLVEYLPELSGENQSYRERKQRYLAWRYREALIVHASAGRANSEEWEHLLKV